MARPGRSRTHPDRGVPAPRAAARPTGDSIEQHEITMLGGGWPGKELFEIAHLFGKTTLTLNHNHPFLAQVYVPIKAASAKDPADLSQDEVGELLTKTKLALDV